MSLDARKSHKIEFTVYAYCSYNEASRMQARIERFIRERLPGRSRIIRVSHGFTDRLLNL